MPKKFTFVDLFAGCGGLSEGFYREGFKALLHLEWDATACQTLRTRMKHYGYKAPDIEKAVVCDDITRPDIVEELSSRIDSDVDILVGGPPCQAFSTQGRAQDPNSMKDDPRNYLFENYLLVLNHFKPKFFVFENVRGILTAKPKGKRIFDEIISKMRKTYKVCNDSKVILLNAADYGVPQIRERVILIGVRNDLDIEPEEIYKSVVKTNSNEEKSKLPPYVTIRDAISDLPFVLPSEGKEVWENYETDIHNDFLSKIKPDGFKSVYNHTARTQNEKDRERYRILSEHQNWQLKDLQKVRPDLINHDPKHFWKQIHRSRVG